MTDAERLFADHQHLARTAACALFRRLRGRMPLDELENAALEGLWQAARSYRPEAGAGFPTWADRRITGAMLDWVRQSSPFNRGQLAARRRGEGPALPVSLEALPDWLEPAVPAEPDPVALADLVALALRGLSAAERRRVTRYHLECSTCAAIAAEEGVNETSILMSLRAAVAHMHETLTATPARRAAVAEYLVREIHP